ncbi:uncharacterized protein EI90DRAFT_2415721 [Cantharellus anzutake]|uniref:uncharacterized protein n=1 Tax=Cantharellus anzutake TaxID=1750568 RepID=UPI001904B66C|nr:uncharacterized protein EI90DRAFT_2415721 [Cantharellus anzutake]KAF8338798.1 hypothetical protein EI90DRAFT_2415721 [Cantharellus anzutake]
MRATPDNGLKIRAQLEREGINVPSLSERTPSANSKSDRKKVIMGAVIFVLENAADALKFVPIPNPDAIPNLLLKWLKVYDTVGGNDDGLKELGNDIRKAYATVLQPLELSEQIPPEVVRLIGGFHSDLEEQINEIELLKSQHLAKRTILAADITKRISGVRTCINNALNSVSTQATILTLLREIEASSQLTLERLPRAAAEHTYVKSKSACRPSTRVKIQKSLLNHLKEAKNRFVWLRGSPEIGKTAISRSIASTLEKEGTLAASFFWDKSRTGVGLDSLEWFPSTLARQLAIFNGDFKASLVKRLRRPDSELILNLLPEEQMKTLVIEPMNRLRGIFSASTQRFGIILDGLDECGDPDALKSLMNLVLLLDGLPSAFVILTWIRLHQTRLLTQSG